MNKSGTNLTTPGKENTMICLYKRTTSAFSLILAVSALTLSSPRNASAQISLGNLGAVLGKSLTEQITKATEATAKRKVNITSLVNTINDSTKEITLELEHKSDEKITARFTIADNPSGGFVDKKAVATNDSIKNKSSLFDEEENKKDTSSVIYKPMSSWITGLPESVTIAPGEKKKITLKIKIPKDAVAGEYAAWIASDVVPEENAAIKLHAVDVAKLIYKK